MVAAVIVSLALVAPAMASEPKGEFSRFKECPRFTTGVNFCLYSQVEKGEVKIGSTAVPIRNTITLQGGYERNEEGEERFFGALNGETLSKTPENVPGGLLDIFKCEMIKGEGEWEKGLRTLCEDIFENKYTGVRAITELAEPASDIGISSDNLLNEEGTALSLPVKVRLENPLLGEACYIGSDSDPIVLNLTTGTTSPPKPNEPIAGKFGHLKTETSEGLTYTKITEDRLVENAFAVPAANGCGGIFAFLVDPIIDAKLGLPSAAGNNTAIQEGTQYYTLAQHVIESES
jgi:hypothetical protein